MTDLRKAAEMALEFVEWLCGDDHSIKPKNKALDVREALRQALAQDSLRKLAEIDRELGLFDEPKQPEQEPETVMAKYEFQTYAAYKIDGEIKIGVVPEPTAWVTAGKHTVPLEVEPVDAVNMTQERVDETAKREHEPVAWRNTETGEFCTGGFLRKDLAKWMPLYTAPPKREWVGLTDEDKKEIKNQATYNWDTTAGEYASKVQVLTEAKLKEKNT